MPPRRGQSGLSPLLFKLSSLPSVWSTRTSGALDMMSHGRCSIPFALDAGGRGRLFADGRGDAEYGEDDAGLRRFQVLQIRRRRADFGGLVEGSGDNGRLARASA